MTITQHAIRLAATALLLSAASTLQAQSVVAGKWIAEFELGMRNVDGEITSMGTGKARMELQLKGDSVFGTWVTLEPAPPAGTASRALRGVFANGVLRLESDPVERRVMMNDTEQRIRMLTRYEVKIEGDAMTGTSQNVAPGGEVDAPHRPFKATREK
jgi:hypothetical protein